MLTLYILKKYLQKTTDLLLFKQCVYCLLKHAKGKLCYEISKVSNIRIMQNLTYRIFIIVADTVVVNPCLAS